MSTNEFTARKMPTPPRSSRRIARTTSRSWFEGRTSPPCTFRRRTPIDASRRAREHPKRVSRALRLRHDAIRLRLGFESALSPNRRQALGPSDEAEFALSQRSAYLPCGLSAASLAARGGPEVLGRIGIEP